MPEPLISGPDPKLLVCVSLLLPQPMDSPGKDVVGMKEGAKGESVSETSDLAGMTNQAVREYRSASFLPVNPWMLKHDGVQGHEGVQARQVGGQTSRIRGFTF